MLFLVQPELQEYLASERFIHDNLARRGENLVARFRELWKKGAAMKPMFFTWPAQAIKSDDGQDIEDACAMYLPESRTEWARAMRNMVIRTSAYALLLLEPREREVKFILESNHGTRTWTIPIQLHGDVHVLGATAQADNHENVGLLWQKNRASSS